MTETNTWMYKPRITTKKLTNLGLGDAFQTQRLEAVLLLLQPLVVLLELVRARDLFKHQRELTGALGRGGFDIALKDEKVARRSEHIELAERLVVLLVRDLAVADLKRRARRGVQDGAEKRRERGEFKYTLILTDDGMVQGEWQRF